ncbi:MAG: hypothetical protein FWE98_03950 [Oscillospiraceae bacterium]|nr:hypothetical protein [Oscillospiraceae bacterium]
MRKNKKLIMAMAIVLAIATAAAGTTFAWFTSNDGKLNHMETGQLTNGDVHIVEVFPDDELRPGDILDKEVKTVNGGSVDALVRLSFAEVIQILADDGAPQNRPAVWVGPVSADNPEIPQLFSTALLAPGGAYGDWIDAQDTASVFKVNNLPAGGKVLYKEFTVDKDGPNERTTYTFVVYGEITANAGAEVYDKYLGKYQYATAKIDVNLDDMELDVSQFQFKVFQYDDLIENKWAPLLDTSDGIDVTGFQQLTSLTTPKLPVNGDFLLTTDDLDAAKMADLSIGLALKSPSDPGADALPADRIGIAMIELYFGATLKTTLDNTVQDGDWWYNQNDGYFYYIGKLAPGQATTNLLENVGLNSGAEDKYNNLLYDLIVKMEAIQNIAAAMSASNGWDMASADAAALADQLLRIGALAYT